MAEQLPDQRRAFGRGLRRLRASLARPFVWWAREAMAKDALVQSAWERGKSDAIAAAKDGRTFGLVATVVTCALPTVVGFLTVRFPSLAQAALIITGAATGYVLVPTGWAIVGAIRAPAHQRNDARQALERLRQPAAGVDWTADFLDWARAQHASLPEHGFRLTASLFGPPEVRMAEEARQDVIDRVHAQARKEYHDRFRASAVAMVGPEFAGDPRSIGDLLRLSERIGALAAASPRGAPCCAFLPPRSKSETFHDGRLVLIGQVAVANLPLNGLGVALKNVYPTITVLREDGSVIYEREVARWTAKPQPYERRDLNLSDPELTTWEEIPANGHPYYVDTVLKFNDENYCYLWTNEGAVTGTRRIDERSFVVEVELHGSNLTDALTQRCRIRHEGKLSRFTIAESATP